MKSLLKQNGMSIVELMIVAGVGTVVIGAMLMMYQQQLRSNNFLEFQVKRTQLHNVLIGQVFNDPNNCACLFAGSAPIPANPAMPGATLNVTPTQLGRYSFVTPGVCGGATMPRPFIDSVGIDGIRATSIRLTNIINNTGRYSGEIVVNVQTMRSVGGPQDLPIRIPVNVATTPAGANANFLNCSVAAAAVGTKLPFSTTCRRFRSCFIQALSVCQAAMGVDSCAESVYCTQADGGDQDIPVVGFTCQSGLCSDGRRGRFHNLTGDNCGGNCNIPPGYTAIGSLDCNPGDTPHVL